MKRVLIPGVILCGADVAQAVDDKNMYMHFFEEMTVYAPVPVPVNGNTHYTSESIERLPTGNGNISDLLRTNPAVRMDSTQSTSLNQGDIRPEKISIHGASPYQNAYLIDGISATNNLNPANESDASSATNISGMSQGYYLDVSLLDNVTLYDSFVPVEFGRFNGGVIDAKIKRFNADDSKVKLGYRTTRSDWLTSHIDENNKSAFNQGSSGSTYYSPDFKKNFYTLSFNQELADNFGVTAGLSRRQSDITRADYVSNDGIVAGRAQYKNVIDTALSKFTWFASDRFTHDFHPKDQVNLWLQIHTGSLQEEDNERGVAHFVEHMMFNGTKTWPGNKVIETFESMGLRFGRDVNAYTSYDETVYQVSLPTTQKQNLQQVMAIFSEWSNAATFEKLEVDAERGVITEEWRAHQDAKWRTSQARRPFLLANTRNLDREPIGLMDTVATVTPAQLRQFYQRWYQPNNMTFIVVGDIDSKEALALIKDNLSKLPANKAAENRVWPTKAENHLRFNIINDKENRVNGIALYYRLPMVQVNDEQSFIEQAEWSMLVQLFNQRLQERIQSGELKTISGGTARSVKIAPDYQSLFFRVNARDDNMQDAANALMAELATIDQHGFSAEELDDVKSTRLTWLKNAVDQQAERDLRMLTSRLASSSLNNTPFLSPEETYQLSKRLWQQITVQSLAEKWQQLRKNQDAFWEQMVNNEVAAKKALSPAAILALEKEYANKKLAAYVFPGRNLSLTVDADPQAEISSKETLAENLTSLTLSNGARVILAKSAGEEQKLQIIAVSNKGDLSFPAQQKSLIALANKAVSGSGVGELSSSSLKRWSAENSVTMSSKVSGMNTLLSVSARTNNPEPGFQLINQRITHSTINDNIWASLQNAQIQALKTLDQRPAEKFAQQMYETRYADDRTKLLQENQIAQFTAADALAADRQLFSSPADITFVIVGNVAEDKLVALITRYLGSIKHSDSPLAAGKPLTRATDNASVTVKEQNEPVAQVSQWKRYDSRTPVNLPTRMALDAFNVALAKDLRVNIREQASGAYSVSSRLSVDPQAKDISHLLAFTCQPERHDELLTLANEVMVKRLAKGISEQELNEYQQNVQRSLDIQQRSVQQLANTIVNSLIQYDDPAAWTEQEQLLKQMTVENVNTAVKQYLSHPVNTYTGVLLPK